jgi:glutamate synthase domain-containing protein 1
MVMSCILGPFYGDLTNPNFKTNFAVYHRRFSTNTNPKWPLAQPFRCLAHNGEINTLIGNVNWQRALDIKRARRDPLCSLGRSDSSNLDAVFENLLRFGKTPAQSMSMLVPEAYRDQPAYDAHPEIVDMFESDDEDVVSKGRLGPGACAVLDARPRPLSGVGPLALSAVCWLARCSPIDAMDRYAAAQAT